MRLVLHIGTEKTATTTLQHFLYHNRAALAARGVGLSDICGAPNNRWLAGYCQPHHQFDNFFRAIGLRSPEEKQAAFADFPDRFAAEVAGLTGDVMVLTSEHCHSRLTDKASLTTLRDLLAPHFSDIRVICYFREQAAVVKSLYSTAIKGGKNATFPDFLKSCTPKSLRYNYAASADLWTDVFGQDAFCPRLFIKDEMVGGDVITDFLDAAGISGEGLDHNIPNQNESLGAYGLMLGRVTNEIHPRYLKNGAANPIWHLCNNAVRHSELGQQGRLSFPQAAEVHALFDETNRDFAARHLGRPDNPFALSKGTTEVLEPVSADSLETFWSDMMQELQNAPVLVPKFAGRLRKIARTIEAGEVPGPEDVRSLRQLAKLIKPKKQS